MRQSSVQTDAGDAFLCPEQLELGHPLYRDLSIATETLLGLAIMVCRLIVLRATDNPDEQEKGFVGNTILLAQPRPEEIMQTLPPSDANVSK